MIKLVVGNFLESDKYKMTVGVEEISINSKDLSKDGFICKQDRNPESSRGSGSSTSSGYSIGSETIGRPTNPEFSGY